MFIISAPDNPKEVIYLLFIAIQLSMDFDLSITQVFSFGILFQLMYEIWFLSPFFTLKLNIMFYQIIAQFDTYVYMNIVHKILIIALICETLLTFSPSVLYWIINFLYPFCFYFPCFDLLD